MKINKESFMYYYNRGFNDSKIAPLMGLSRSYISEFRRSLSLPRMSLKQFYGPAIEELVNKGHSDNYISKQIGLSKSHVQYTRKKMNLKTNFIERTYDSKLNRKRGYMVRNLKDSARRRNIEFDLKFEDLELPKNCPILNIPLCYNLKANNPELISINFNGYNHATVDRIDNSKGYIKGNVIVISRMANAMKNCASFEELETFCKNIKILINFYKNQGALGSITDIFPDIELLEI